MIRSTGRQETRNVDRTPPQAAPQLERRRNREEGARSKELHGHGPGETDERNQENDLLGRQQSSRSGTRIRSTAAQYLPDPRDDRMASKVHPRRVDGYVPRRGLTGSRRDSRRVNATDGSGVRSQEQGTYRHRQTDGEVRRKTGENRANRGFRRPAILRGQHSRSWQLGIPCHACRNGDTEELNTHNRADQRVRCRGNKGNASKHAYLQRHWTALRARPTKISPTHQCHAQT